MLSQKLALRCLWACLVKNENTSDTSVLIVNPGATRTKMRAEAMPGENPETLPSSDVVAEAFLYGLTKDAASITRTACQRP